MNRLFAISLFLLSTTTVSAQYDTLHTEVLNFTIDTLVPNEFYKISIGLKEYYNWSGKTHKKKAQQYFVSLDSGQARFFDHLSQQGIKVQNIFTHNEALVPATWRIPAYNARHITFEVTTKSEAKQVYDSFLDKGIYQISINGAISDSLKKQITTSMEEQALKDCAIKAMSSVESQGYDSFMTYYVQHYQNYAYTAYGQTATNYIGTHSISYEEIHLMSSIQFSFHVLRKSKDLVPEVKE